MNGPAPDRSIVSRRRFAAARTHLWHAFEDPAVLASWWGPAAFTNTFLVFDFRAGGAWEFTMNGPDGAAYHMRKEFVEVRAPERLVMDHPDATHGFRMTITLSDAELGENEPAGTDMTWVMTFDDAAEAARVRDIVETSNEQNFDRLADYLSTSGT